MTQETQDGKIEIKTIKEVKYLPKVFLLKHSLGGTTKVIMSDGDFIDCSKEKGKLMNCFELRDNKLRKTEALYYIPGYPLLLLDSQKRLYDEEKYARNIIITTLTIYGLIDKDLLITYNEHNIQAYNKFYKAQVLQFQTYYGSETIEIYEVPSPSPDLELWFERIDNVKIHNHEIGFTNDANIGIDMVELYSKPNPVYLIYSKISADMTIKYPDNKISTITLGQEKYYLMVFLKNIEEETEEEEGEIFDYQ